MDRNGTLDRGLKTQHGCVSFAKSVEVDASPPFLYSTPGVLMSPQKLCRTRLGEGTYMEHVMLMPRGTWKRKGKCGSKVATLASVHYKIRIDLEFESLA